MRKATVGNIIKGGAVVLDVAAPLTATLTQFPAWIERSADATVSGLFLILAFLSAVPFLKQIREYFKSPDAWVIWCVIFSIFVVLQNIVEEMLIVSFVGLIANLIGKGTYKLGDFIASRPDRDEGDEESSDEENEEEESNG